MLKTIAVMLTHPKEIEQGMKALSFAAGLRRSVFTVMNKEP